MAEPDITERLKMRPWLICAEAASEIERLRYTIAAMSTIEATYVNKDTAAIVLRISTPMLPGAAVQALRDNVVKISQMCPNLPPVILVPGCVDVEVRAKEESK